MIVRSGPRKPAWPWARGGAASAATRTPLPGLPMEPLHAMARALGRPVGQTVGQTRLGGSTLSTCAMTAARRPLRTLRCERTSLLVMNAARRPLFSSSSQSVYCTVPYSSAVDVTLPPLMTCLEAFLFHGLKDLLFIPRPLPPLPAPYLMSQTL